MREITITSLNEGQRADKFVRKYLKDAPLSFIYKLFRIKDVKINGKRIDGSYILKNGDVMRIYVTDKQIEEFSKPRQIVNSSINFEIVYEDENILIANKPSGLLIHGDESEKRITLTNLVLNYLYNKGEFNPSNIGFIPSPCHRLDRNTSGLVVFAKNMISLQELELLFKDKKNIKKEYLGLIDGILSGSGKIDAPLYKDEKKNLVSIRSKEKGGKEALTKYEIIENFDRCSLALINIITGRTHQIRVHFSSISHPILGDAKYGNFKANREFEDEFKYKGQFLHAYRLSFFTINGSLSYLSGKVFVAPLSSKQQQIIESLRGQHDF